MNVQPPAGSVDEWVTEISEAIGVDAGRVSAIRREQRVPGARVLTSRAKLHLDAVHFAGIKELRTDSADGEGNKPNTLEAFSFSHRFDHPVTAFATRQMNDAGKSSIINVATWGLRGRSNLQADVQGWIRHAALQLTVGDERILVLWVNDGKKPVGQVMLLGEQNIDWDDLDATLVSRYEREAAQLATVHTAPDALVRVEAAAGPSFIDIEAAELIRRGAVEIASFESEASFEAAMSDVLMPRLGFESIEAWQGNSNSSEADDGNLVDHGWMLWSQALSITDPSVKVTLGETTISALPLLHMYLGTKWGPATTAATARTGVMRAELASLTRRRRAEDESAKAGVAELETQIEGVLADIAASPILASLEEIDEALADAAKLASDAAAVNLLFLQAGAELGQMQRLVDHAEAEEAALAEAAVTQRFWHSLKPSCCPRCDTAVDDARWQREQDGNCSLCDSPMDEPAEEEGVADGSTSPGDAEEDPDELMLARERTEALRAALSFVDAEYDRLRERKGDADEQVRAGKNDPRLAGADPRIRRELENRLATLRGRLEERQARADEGADVDEREQTLAVLEEALKTAKKKRDEEQNEMLKDVNERLTAMGRALGINQLESATLKGNTQMPVVKGGASSPFGKLTDGEKLRLKIALVIALLHVGTAAGVGRHPGVLLIDSLAREELNPDDAKTLLEQLSKVAEDNDLQIITSSAHGELVEASLPAGATRLSDDKDFMW